MSHAETVRMFQRASVRAGINLQYSQGFNPHPRLSLPLPRSVGLESDDELLTAAVKVDRNDDRKDSNLPEQIDVEKIKNAISVQLPTGCEVLSVAVAEGGRSFQPQMATYLLQPGRCCDNRDLENKIKHLMESDSITLDRCREPQGPPRRIDVRKFLKSIRLEKTESGKIRIIVECRVSPAGAIRVDEILKILELDQKKLTAPVRLIEVRWT